MNFREYLKENDLLKSTMGDVLGMSSMYSKAQPFKSSKNLTGTFSVLVYQFLKELVSENPKIKIDVKDVPGSKFDFQIYINGKKGYDSSIARKIEKPIKFTGGGSISHIASVIKQIMPELKITQTNLEPAYAKVYLKTK